ncbi:MAG TPA: dienelactone hydrolase family protein [Spirochaetia bacterium]
MNGAGAAGDPHAGGRVLTWGPPLSPSVAALIMVHGRGATAEDILELAPEIAGSTVSCLAPQASGRTWYPYPFLAPIAQNEPGISSGLGVLAALVRRALDAGVPAESIFLLGFSQGACLTLEFAARNARRYGGIIGLSGGLIGPDWTPRDYPGSMEGTPVFLGCSDRDPHIPKERVLLTRGVFTDLGAAVDARLYPDMGHTVNEDEVLAVRAILSGAVRGIRQ